MSQSSSQARGNEFWRPVAALVLFGVTFGYVEAALVTYLREIYDPLRRNLHPGLPPGELFPLIRTDQLAAAGPPYWRLLVTEWVREAATMGMLGAMGLAVARSPTSWVAGFLVSFGLWDIFYYVFLKVLIDWPSTSASSLVGSARELLLAWDLLFLIPVPWVGPILAPILIAISMVLCGVWVLWRDTAGRPIQVSARHWLVIIGGGLIMVVAFCWDYRNTMAGQMPESFQWPLFWLGELVGLSGFAAAVRTSTIRKQTAGN